VCISNDKSIAWFMVVVVGCPFQVVCRTPNDALGALKGVDDVLQSDCHPKSR
jgi:hypothetical protein